VVVDGSTDRTIEILNQYGSKLPQMRYYYQSNQGRACVRNKGALEAMGELLIYFDDDMLPETKCIQSHEEFFLGISYGILVGRQFDLCDQTAFQRFRKSLSLKWEKPLLDAGTQRLMRDAIYLTAANFCILKSTFLHLGGFDARLSDAEDFDLAVRAFELDIPIYYCSAALAFHNDPITGRMYIRRLREYRKAHEYLRAIEPLRYSTIRLNQPIVPSGIKGMFFRFFASQYWVNWLDRDYFKWLIPRFIRHRLFDWIITANGSFFPDRVSL
jgi:glycosyltransferase involved in cell wall biosynthesis